MYDTLLKHPSLIKFVKLLDKTNGRDKLLRFVQYLLKFLSFYYHKSSLNSIATNLTNCRKSIRIGKPLSHLLNASNLFDDKLSNPTLIRSLSILKELSYANYLSLDSLVWFKNIGIIKPSKTTTKIERLSSLAWFTGVLSNLIISLIKYYNINFQLKELSKESTEKRDDEDLILKLTIQKQALKRRFVWDILDLTIVSNKLQFIQVDDGLVGLSGTITSFFGIEDIWNSITA